MIAWGVSRRCAAARAIFLMGGTALESGTGASKLTGLGLTEREARDVLASASDAERIRLLRRSRGRMLEELHARQQRLDRLDYYIHQLRQSQEPGQKVR